jgi:hypothetical protein
MVNGLKIQHWKLTIRFNLLYKRYKTYSSKKLRETFDGCYDRGFWYKILDYNYTRKQYGQVKFDWHHLFTFFKYQRTQHEAS